MENRKHTSLKDLAQALGVSIPTVSRALKDSPEISRELCTKAKALAKEMNYRPNPFAMSLRKNAPRIIGVVVPDIVTHFFASILNGIENMAIANGYFVIITTSHESSVIADGAQSAQMATQHLLDNGSKRVAFIGGANHLDIVKRRKHGYLEALRENRIPIEKELVVCRKIDYEEGKIATETLLSLPQPPDAILAMNDTLAFAAMEVVKNHGLRIPNDVAIIGYTDEQHANYVEPKLSAVSHQTYKMGETACQLLIDQIKGDKTIKQVTIPTHLQIRESSIKKTKM